MLLDVFGKEPGRHLERPAQVPRFDALRTNEELVLLWASDPAQSPSGSPPEGRLPHAIVVRSNETREFIAWVTTFIGGYRPFTAFFRVIDPELARLAFEPKEPTLGTLENAVAGLIIAEALTLSSNQRSVSALLLLPSESTYSYSFARALALGYVRDGSGHDPISSPLAVARRLTRQPARKLADELLGDALKVLSRLATGKVTPGHSDVPAIIWQACQELLSHGGVKRSWDLLGGRGAPASQVLDEMRGPREHRVRTFERVLKGMDQLDVLTASFLTGLLADQIAPGTFEHVDLVLPYLNRYPTALVWYGLCAGLHPDSDIQQIGNCLGRRLTRDLLASDPITSRPKYDISVGELEVYLDREQPLEFRVASQSHIAVELLPGVPAYMKWPVSAATESASAGPRETSLSSRANQPELPLKPSPDETHREEQGMSTEQQDAIRELERAVERVKHTLRLDEELRGRKRR
jgi:hypothetical protein